MITDLLSFVKSRKEKIRTLIRIFHFVLDKICEYDIIII